MLAVGVVANAVVRGARRVSAMVVKGLVLQRWLQRRLQRDFAVEGADFGSC